MTPANAIDVSGLPPFEISNRAPLWWGQLLLCAIEGSMFFILIAMYFYLRISVDAWPPPGVRPLRLDLATIALAPLLLSAAGSYAASEGAKQNRRGLMLGGLGANLALAAVFLIFRFVEWRTFNFTWASDAHGTIVWSILFLHTFDVVADLLMTLALLLIVAAGRGGPKQRIGVHVDSVVWYFLVLIWLPLYAVVYWGPRLVRTP
jgi:heme/copper-type cytochrome/quinol oxidase subunit 3